MSIILKKETLQTGRVVSQKYSQTNVECDVIVPDINPDIQNVLDVSGFISVSEKSFRAGKVYIHGTVYMTVLYAPDGEVLNKVKSLSASQEFNHSIDTGCSDDDAQLTTEVEAESFNYSLINSRKLSLRCTTGINIKLTKPESFEIASDADASDAICTKTKMLRLCNTAVNSESRISICEQVELPSGEPSISEILKTTVCPESTELTLMENQALAKGQVKVCFLYTSLDDGSVQTAEYTLPFTETLDIEGAEEDMEGEIEYSVSDLYCEVRDDSDGEPRIFGIDLALCATVRGISIREPNIICDAYALHGNAELTSHPVRIEQLIDNTTAQLTHKTSVPLPDGLPEISKICDISVSASVDRISAENGEITVFGSLKSNILYISDDEGLPLRSFNNTSEFSHTLTAPLADSDTICEAKIFTEHTSFTLNGSNSVDLRIVLGLCVRSFKSEEISPVTEIEISEETESGRKPCILIYFVKSGDTLWNIAKRYKTTVESLKECNGLTSDMIYIGQQIRICR